MMLKFYKRFFCIFLFTIGLMSAASAQQRYTISGTVQDASNGEELIGATILVTELTTGGTTNVYGFYSITIPEGSYKLEINFIGYQQQEQLVTLDKNLKLNFELVPESKTLQEVIVKAEREDKNIQSTQMSVNKLEMKDIENVPVLFGEQDVIKTIQLLPGISSTEGGGGFFVRGGSADQNLILLDEAPVYNASHLLGFFSVFNSDAIKDVAIYKGYIPAEYGGRASSVLDIKMNDGNSKKLNVGGGIGLISSKLTVEAPIVKDKGSFILSGRRTYLDLFLKLSGDDDVKKSILYFYDFNAKANYRINENNRIFVSGYFGRDKFGFSDQFGFDWGNSTATLRWNHIFNPKLFLNSTVLFSDYNYDVKIAGDEDEDNGFRITSAIQDFSVSEDFEYFINPSNTVKFGASGIHHQFVPGKILPQENSDINEERLQEKYAWEMGVYISDDIDYSEKIKFSLGLRYSWFGQIGPGDIFMYDADGDISSTKTYESGELIQSYGGIEPRLGITYILNDETSIKASYGRNRQYLHLVSNSTSGTPIDLWIPSSNNVKPQIADQIALGYFRNFSNNRYESFIEVYYKGMQNQVDYKTGAELVFNENVESQLLFGDGWSYGTEVYIKKRVGDLTGWISYTLSRTERKFNQVDYGEVYPASWDRTNDISVVGMYNLNEKWTLSAAFVYQTGRAVTYPVGKYQVDGEIINLYDKRNNNRLPDYNRLDLGATLLLKDNNKFTSSLNFSIYNVYARKNAYSIYFRENPEDATRTEALKLSLFTFVPSITYIFTFK